MNFKKNEYKPFYGRPYGSMFVTAEEVSENVNLSPREWIYEYHEDIDFHFSTLLSVLNKHFPKQNIEYTKKLFQEFEKFAFENSSQ